MKDVSDTTSKGIALMIATMLFVPAMTAIGKFLAGDIPPIEIVFVRFVVQTLLILPFACRAVGRKLLQPTHVPFLAVRGAVGAFATLFFFSALAFLPLADTTAIYFILPFVLALLAAVFLGETIGWRRGLAITVGFGGALLVIRPSFAEFGWPALLPIGAAISVAIFLTLTRKLGKGVAVEEMQVHAGVWGLVVIGSGMLFGTLAGWEALTPVWPTPFQWLLLCGVGVVATISHFMMAKAFVYAPASLLAPFQYLEIIGATLYGLVLFGSFPDRLAWTGIGIIVASGLFVIWRGRDVDRTTKSPADGRTPGKQPS